MSNIIKIGGVRGFIDENGVAQLNAEDVARGWGFVKTETKAGKVYESIRWARVNEYLAEFGFRPQVGENDFLPENMVYRLGFKASNETAQAFQAKLADEILPTIRKTGSYSVKQAPALPDFTNPVIAARAWADEVEKKQLAEAKVKVLTADNAKQSQIIGELKPKADYTDKILQNKGLVAITQIAKDYGMSGKTMNQKLHELKIIYKIGKQWVLYADYQAKGYTHSDTFNFKHNDGRDDVTMNTKWTQKGRLFLYEELKKHGILPMIEQD